MTSAINNAIPVSGTLIDAVEIRNNFATAKAEVTALQADKLAKDGTVTPTANLPMGGFKHTGAATASATGQYVEYTQNATLLAGKLSADGTVNPAANLPMAGFKHTGVAAATAAGQYIEYAQAYVIAGLGKNCLINGNFTINQRAVTGTVVLAAGAYGHDRWKAGAGGCTYTFTLSSGITTLTITAGTLLQIIEGSNLPLGTNTCVLSWTGTAQGRFGVGSYAASGATASVVGGTNLSIEFNTGTLSMTQLEKGAVATPFEQRMTGYELALCQYYYEQITAAINQAIAAGFVFSTTVSSVLLSYQMKRTTPTITITSAQIYANGAAVAATTNTVYAGLSSARVDMNAAVAVAGGGATLKASAGGGAVITISAEL
jgi:hypothetical protein